MMVDVEPSSEPSELPFCRTCLAATEDLRSIYKAGTICGQVMRLADMLASCTNLEVSGPRNCAGDAQTVFRIK